MVLGSSIKLFLISAVVLYTSYLYLYKCEQVSGLESILHPLNHSHKTLCTYVAKSEEFLTPFAHKGQSLLDEHVHSTEFFKKHQIHEKIVHYSQKGYEIAHPILIQIFQYIEIIEVYVYDHAIEAYKEASAFVQVHGGHYYNEARNYVSNVITPKVKEFTN